MGGPRTARRLLLAVCLLYGLGLAALAMAGQYAFVVKTAVVPVLLIVALGSGRLTSFVDDWAIFLGFVVLFDFVRGLIFTVVRVADVPVRMAYAIDLERWLCNGSIPTIALQARWATPGGVGWIDEALTAVHGSHFVFFLLFGMLLWVRDGADFRRFCVAMVLMMYAGLVIYLLIPTVPPWMASAFGVLPAVRHLTDAVYNVALPTLHAAFDTNPIAAMPSLHAAFPTLVTLIACYHYRWRAVPAVVYTAAVWLAIVYLGEHYVVDIVAGVALSAVVFVFVYHTDVTGRLAALYDRLQLRPLITGLLLVVIAHGIGHVTVTQSARPFPDEAFVRREMLGQTPLAHLWLGRSALAAGRLPEARDALRTAVATIDAPREQQQARLLLAVAAGQQGAWAEVRRALEPLGVLPAYGQRLLGEALVRTGAPARGLHVLDTRAAHGDAQARALAAALRYRRGELDADAVRTLARALAEVPAHRALAAGLLRQTVGAVPTPAAGG